MASPYTSAAGGRAIDSWWWRCHGGMLHDAWAPCRCALMTPILASSTAHANLLVVLLCRPLRLEAEKPE